MTTKTTEALKIEMRKEITALATDMSGLDHNHESATNWLHTVTTSPAFSDAGKRRLEYNKAHDNLMEIQAKQDELGGRIWRLQQKLKNS